MTELERRALLGDKQAQEECTENGILLPCPCCGSAATTKVVHAEDSVALSVICSVCNLEKTFRIKTEMLDAGFLKLENEMFNVTTEWNRRIVPLIGRCGECANSPDIGTRTKGMRWCRRFRGEVNPNGYCNYFKPKEHEEK